MATDQACALRSGARSRRRRGQRLGGSGRASAILRMTGGVFFPSFASATSCSLAAATCAGVTSMTRRLAMSASPETITSWFEGTYLSPSLRTCRPDRALAHRAAYSRSQAHNVARFWTSANNSASWITIRIGALTISLSLWSTRKDSQDGACAEPYRNRGADRVRQVTTSASPMRLGGESGP